jgi:quercetin dioxygenase-like cupin family protein
MTRILVARLDALPGVACPCGTARRAFAGTEGSPASVHVVDICADSRVHYHKRQTEIYTVLEGEGVLEADGERIALAPLVSVVILPGCRHRAVGRLRILNVVIPPFDAADEFEDA